MQRDAFSFVIPVQAGIQSDQFLDTGLRRCDGLFELTFMTWVVTPNHETVRQAHDSGRTGLCVSR